MPERWGILNEIDGSLDISKQTIHNKNCHIQFDYFVHEHTECE